ncbi:MAG: cold shock domain-containing protein [Gammaproteobacteria bacterium]
MNGSVFKGTLKTWKDDRGFGFIKPDNDDKDIFIHISAFKDAGRRPWRGDIIYYQVQPDKGGKMKAVNARIESESAIMATGSRKTLYIAAVLLLLLLLAAGALAHYFGTV